MSKEDATAAGPPDVRKGCAFPKFRFLSSRREAQPRGEIFLGTITVRQSLTTHQVASHKSIRFGPGTCNQDI